MDPVAGYEEIMVEIGVGSSQLGVYFYDRPAELSVRRRTVDTTISTDVDRICVHEQWTPKEASPTPRQSNDKYQANHSSI